MKVFRITGEFKMGETWSRFTKETIQKDEKAATEWVFSDLGGKHGVPRRFIRITEVAVVKPEEITDPVVSQMIKKGMVKI